MTEGTGPVEEEGDTGRGMGREPRQNVLKTQAKCCAGEQTLFLSWSTTCTGSNYS